VLVESGGYRVSVDAGIAPLMHAVWKIGLRTWNSCEDSWFNPGHFWIEFCSAADAEAFLFRALEGAAEDEAARAESKWLLKAHLCDETREVRPSQDGRGLEVVRGPSFVPRIFVSVYIPVADLARVTERITSAADGGLRLALPELGVGRSTFVLNNEYEIIETDCPVATPVLAMRAALGTKNEAT
jgi:hypothetical protein